MPDPRDFQTFLAAFTAHVPPADFRLLSTGSVEQMGHSLWNLALHRQPGTPTVRLSRLNPADGEAVFPQTVIEIVNDDMPFLVGSVVAEINRRGSAVNLVIHPVLKMRRDGAGNLLGFGQDGQPDARPESLMHIRIPALAGGQAAEDDLQQRILSILTDVRMACQDWEAMREAARDAARDIARGFLPVPPEVAAESADFMNWLLDHNFTFIGYRELEYSEPSGENGAITVRPGSGLGILRDEGRRLFMMPRYVGALPEDIRLFLEEPRLVHFSKADEVSTVHRSAPLDVISIKTYNDQGVLTGERRFSGLFTAQVYHRSPRFIPILRQKLATVLQQAGFDPNGHDGKALLHILETFPRDELWLIGTDELLRIAVGILNLQERQRTALFVRRDPFGRYASCFVHVPRDQYNLALRQRIQALLEQGFGGNVRTVHATVEESAHARLYFVINTDGTTAAPDIPAIEQALVDASQSWEDKLRLACLRQPGGVKLLPLVETFAGAFPLAYQDTVAPAEALADIAILEEIYRDERLKVRLKPVQDALPHMFLLKLFSLDNPLPLSDILPVLENMGLRVLSEQPFELRPTGRTTAVWRHEFEISTANRQPVDIKAIEGTFADALLQVWTQQAEDDTFNRLVLAAGLPERQVTVLRALSRFLKQAGFPFEQDRIATALVTHPALAVLFMQHFTLRHDPAQTGPADGVTEQITTALSQVTDSSDDRILTALWQVLQAILRTNAFQADAKGQRKNYLSLKLDSGALPFLPLPRPWREIFVYSPDMEGIHLRGGPVARGGIRWSDRKDDYRQEVLGLLKAQMVKNAVIVPTGSKGGFVIKRPPADDTPEARRQASINAYTTFIQGLLDITDNRQGGAVIPPAGVVRHDGDDPYLVVAADKGTATFSDLANGISARYGFWLGDAFASGGSVGYDHKKMGITARGGWEAVKRHFRELGKDIQSTPFTVVGVGDMSGDVFGNGMLLSPHILLKGAFNHQHIFIDPNPDAATGFAERERLFNLPRSSWMDYDPAKLSPGGGVYDRNARAIPLSPEARQWLGITAANPTPVAVIQALLKAEVELLWFGGIGTYVRATTETNADVGDKANDSVRVTGLDVRAQVIGEGANLALTQQGRIEYALAKGRLNTDAIDNSAGVDCSDHEVNIKILLQQAMQDTGLSLPDRDALLARMTDDVAQLVLRDNYLQTQALSVAEHAGTQYLHPQAELVRRLEREGKLDRDLEFLPSDATVDSRFQQDRGLTRPELAVLLAYAKIDITETLLASSLPDEPRLVDDLLLYFPPALREKYPAIIARHPLRREIIATHAANSIVNRMGPQFANSLHQSTGLPMSDVVRAYSTARQVFDLRSIWGAIEALDNHAPASVQYSMHHIVGQLLARATLWFIRNGPHPLDVNAQVEAFRPAVEELAANLSAVLSTDGNAQWAERTAKLEQAGVPGDLARRVAASRPMAAACDIARIARDRQASVQDAARVYYRAGEELHFDWLRDAARSIKVGSAWQQQALEAIVGDLRDAQRDLAARILATGGFAGWQAANAPQLGSLADLLADLRAAKKLELAMLLVATRMLKGLAG